MTTNKSNKSLDAAGWLFWFGAFVVLLPPCLFGSWQVSREEAPVAYKIAFGLMAAALASGIVSWAVNTVLQRRVQKRKVAERKKAKKRK